MFKSSHGAYAQVGRDGSERRASAVAASTVWRRDAAEDGAGESFQRPGREAPKPRTKRRASSAGDARDSEGVALV